MATSEILAATLDLARTNHLAGQLERAEQLYAQVLAEAPATADALHGLAIMALQIGNNPAALGLISRAIEIAPEDWRYLCTQGQVLIALGRLEESAAAYRRATEFNSECVEALFGLGLALQAAGNRIDAIPAYQRALQLRPDYVEAHNNLGNALQTEGQLEPAILAYCQALKLRPDYFECLSNLGGALQAAGKTDEAIVIYRRAMELKPEFAPLCNNLGNALAAARQTDEAITHLRRAVELNPQFAQGWYNLGNVLRDKSDNVPAADAYRRAIEISPDYVEAHNNLGNVLHTRGEFKEAAKSYLKALSIRPDFVDAYTNVGAALRTMGQIDQAIDLLRQAIFLKADFHIAHCNLGNILKDAGRLDEALDCFRRAVHLKRSDHISHANLAYAVNFHPDYDSAGILRENLAWNAAHAQRLSVHIRPHDNERSPNRRLRIGYVSPDFREHCQALFTVPLLSHHNHDAFEIFCYSSVSRPDAITQRLATYADAWRTVTSVSDANLAEMVRADHIDILVDLTMHMSYGRSLTFAQKPAPVQVAYLAYPGTTGMSVIDWRLTDPHLDPPGENDWNYSEKSFRLFDTFWCYDPLTAEPDVNPLPAMENGHITFGCLNNFCKITAPTITLWRRVMEAVPNSRLIVLAASGSHRQKFVADLGIAPERIEFVDFQPRQSYLGLYHRIDVGLDTIPYNGHTTSLDSLWMGVPVVTRIGRTVVGRAGWSQLRNLNMTELAAASDDEFVNIAVGLVNDLPRLSDLRATLRSRMEASPLMDADRFARNVESAYRLMWTEYCAGR